MNPALTPLFARRSVRRFQPRPVPPERIQDLLEAAMAAPSANARDPWEFIVVEQPGTLARISEGLPAGKMLARAPLGVVICGDLTRANGQLLSYLLQDCSAAIQNLLLALPPLGLGGVWLGVHPREDRVAHLRGMFQLPDHIVPVGVVAIGYPDETPPPRTRFNPARVHHEQWTPPPG
ncbi:MAG: nitroreductase family protein [Lentisphaerae bacterium]|jgi:nitroreductase|nr:nitroreductase family protein [Lentisphaerota bacterium]